jgi:FeoB-associated Cys-rich membrane protein
MIWQPLLVAALVLAAASYISWQTWRTWFSSKAGCGGGCSCPGKKAEAKTGSGAPVSLISVNELTQRIRSQK